MNIINNQTIHNNPDDIEHDLDNVAFYVKDVGWLIGEFNYDACIFYSEGCGYIPSKDVTMVIVLPVKQAGEAMKFLTAKTKRLIGFALMAFPFLLFIVPNIFFIIYNASVKEKIEAIVIILFFSLFITGSYFVITSDD